MHEAELKKIKEGAIGSLQKAKRKVAQEDLKAQIKENNTRLKEEVRFGKGVAQAKQFFRSKEYQASSMASSDWGYSYWRFISVCLYFRLA